MTDNGYVNFFEILELDETAKPGEVRKNYKRMMKDLVMEIARVQITEKRRAEFLLEMAKLNAAFYLLRDSEARETYWRERTEVMDLEERWCKAVAEKDPRADQLRREFDGKCRNYLSKYVEETMLAAGRDPECVEASHWDAAHERHASRLLRHYRHRAHRRILERLPFVEVTEPRVDWAERAAFAQGVLAGGTR